ncbi:hypothetical protein GQ55_9G178000 [Panicum hallii var. hallii]|uniref:Uncharacterized protein n=1 Tax=Panicum hallii var. hallii TaxID=1504633 RepID=A0A2T7C4D7_9POAL|nr:hypothetical protein GQ55_9G178000 [Panicum hallii var. hallii]
MDGVEKWDKQQGAPGHLYGKNKRIDSARSWRAAAMEKPTPPAFVYRISTADEWAELQRTGATLGGDLDRSTGCIHLSDLGQVKMTLKNFFLGRNDLYLLQIDTSKPT